MNKEILSVLLIEDSPSDADLFQEMLREASVMQFRVLVAERLSDGLKQLANTRFDLILLDLSLPDSHGMETFSRIQMVAAQTPVIVLTGMDDETLALKAVSLGAQDYLIKGNVASNLLAHAIRYSIERKRLTNILHIHEQEFKTLVENAPDVISRIDQDLRRVYVNPAIEAATGIPPGGIIGKTYQELGSIGESIPRLEDAIRTVFKSGEPQLIEYAGPSPTGWHYYQTRIVPEFSEDGSIATVLSIARDITERKQMEIALQESDERYRALFERSLDAVYLQDFSGRFLDANTAALNLLGYSKNEIVDLDVQSLLSADSLPLFLQTTLEIQENGTQSEVHEFKFRTKSGQEIVVEKMASLIFRDGKAWAIQAVARDITARKKAEEALRESERFARSAVNALSAHIAILDETGQIVAVNSSWRAFASANNAVLRSVLEGANYLQVCDTAVGAEAEDAAAFAAGIRAVIQGKQGVFSLEYACHSPTEKRWFMGHITRFQGEGPIRVVIAHENITERKRAEQTIRASEERLGALIQNSSDIISVFDTNGITVFQSPAIERVMGYQPAAIIGLSVFDVIHPDDLAATRNHFDELVQGEMHTISIEMRLMHLDGSWRTLEAVMTNQLDNPAIKGVVVNSRDITQRKKSEKELAALYNATSYLFKSDSLLNLAHQIVDAVVTEFGQADCRLILINKAQDQLVQLASADNKQLTAQTTLSLNTSGLLQDAVRTGKTIYQADISMSNDADTAVHAELIIPLRSMNGVIGLLELRSSQAKAFDDMNQRVLVAFGERAASAIEAIKLYEQINQHATELEGRVARRTIQLQRSKDRLEAILNHSSDAIILTEPDGVIQQLNQTFYQQFNYPIDEEFGKPLSILINSDESQKVVDMLTTVVQTKESQRLDMAVLRRDGTLFDADIAMSPIMDTNANVIGVIWSIRDISTHKKLEESLRVALMKQKELNEMKTGFLSMVSHDFRTPLAVILSSSDLLRSYYDRMNEQKRIQQFDKIRTQIDRMVALLNDVLTINRSDAGATLFDPLLIDLNRFCEEMAEEFQSAPNMKHTLAYSCSGQSINLLVDEKLIQQALINLLTNTFKYSPEGSSVEFNLSFDEDQAVIRIKDSGIGIPEADLPRLFETFHRAGNVGQIQGTGLGLAIVKRAIEAHGGTIAVESHIGTGTIFAVSLPLPKLELSVS